MQKDNNMKEAVVKEDIRARIINEAVKDADKKFGKGVLVQFKKDDKDAINLTSAVTNTISCGAVNIDLITCKDRFGKFGFPRGRIIYIVGKESCGKTTLALEFAAEAQKNHNAIVYYLDQEHALDLPYATRIGFMKECAILSNPESTEKSIEIISNTLDKYEDISAKYGEEAVPPIVLIWDTFSASPTNKELEKGKTSGGGEHARISSGMMRKWTKRIGKFKMILLILNQEKSSINMGGFSWGGPKAAFLAEKPQKFHSSIGFSMVRIGWIKGLNKRRIGQTVLVRNEKNKLAMPYRDTEIKIYFGKGINKNDALFEALLLKNLVRKETAKESKEAGRKSSKGWWVIEGLPAFKNFSDFLEDNSMKTKVLNILFKKKEKKSK
jgi:recombination protein RecA